ncbi:hypothetical protein DFQ26_006448 [Actinomortierella ambigua]|nr:hypothetical protein DFQ26_006448 [Actinomortierella ambigua]
MVVSADDPTVEVPIPHYINALVITALISAVVCNIFIFIRFLERHVYLATVLSLVAATIQDILSLAAVIPFCRKFRPSDGYVYDEGFWSMVASMIFSFAATILMSIDLHMTPNFRAKGSGVTHKQRILIVEAMGFCFYLAMGALCIFFIEPGWTFLESLFFAEVTITTIGFGDRVISSTGGRFFVIAYASGGIVLFAVCINGIRYVIMEDLHQRFARLAKIRKAKRDADRQEKIRQRRIQRRLKRLQLAEQRSAGQTIHDSNPEHTTTLYRYFTQWATRRLTQHPSSASPPKSQTIPLQPVGTTPLSVTMASGNHVLWRHSPTSSPLGLHRVHTVDGTEGTAFQARYGPQISDARGSEPNSTSREGSLRSPPPRDLPLWMSVFQGPTAVQSTEPVEVLTPKDTDSDSMRSTSGSMRTSSGGLTDDELDHADDFHGDDLDSDDNDEDGDGDQERSKSFLSHLNPFRRRKPLNSALRSKERSSSQSSADLEREQAYLESMDEYRRRVQLWVVVFIFFWVVGATVFTLIEGWDYATSIYFVFVAFSTIGYGDVVPQTIAGRSFFLGYCLVGVVTVTSLASVVSEVLSKKMRRHVVEAQLKKHRKLVGLQAPLGGDNHPTSPGAPDGATPHDIELGHEQTPQSQAPPPAGHKDDTFLLEDEKQYRANLKRMVKVSEHFHALLHHVLTSSKKGSTDVPNSTGSPVHPFSSHGSPRLQPSTYHTSRSASNLNDSSSAALSWQESGHETKRSIYEYLNDTEDNPSISRDLDIVREVASSVGVWHPQVTERSGRSQARGVTSSIETYHGSPSHSGRLSTSEQLQIMEWPVVRTTSPTSESAAPTVSNTHSRNNSHPKHSRSSSTHIFPPMHHRVDQILRTSKEYQHKRSSSIPERSSSEPPVDSLPSDNHLSANTIHHRHPDQGLLHPSPEEQHIIKIDSKVFSQLCAYADDCQQMVRDFEVTLDRLLAWEKREQKLQRRRQKTCARQEALLQEREERLASMRGRRGELDEELDEEQELIKVTRRALKLLQENPVGGITSTSRRSSAAEGTPGASRSASTTEAELTTETQVET